MKAILLLLVAALVGNGSPTQETSTTVSGTVTLRGDPPKAKRVTVTCPKCVALFPGGMPREDLIVDGENHVQGAFVYVKAGLEGKQFEVPKTPVVLDQNGCRYEPHVLGMMAGQKLILRNNDHHDHCTHALPFSNKEFNIGLKSLGKEMEKTFEHQEVAIKLKDDVYPWMSAWVGVFEHPFYAVTGPKGTFEIKGLPPGKYTLAVWQERCSGTSQEIEVNARDSKTADFTLDLKKE